MAVGALAGGAVMAGDLSTDQRRRILCRPTQCRHPRLLSPPCPGRQAHEGGAHHLYATIAGHPERDRADKHDVAAERSVRERLALKTVAIIWEDIYSVQFDPGAIDTVIFRQSVEHLDFEFALLRIDFEFALLRIIALNTRRVVIFQSNLNPLLKWTHGRIGHDGFQRLPFISCRDALQRNGSFISQVVSRNVIAFPRPGGLVMKRRVPPYSVLEKLIVAISGGVGAVMNARGRGPWPCWRCLLVADQAVMPLRLERAR